MTRRTACLVVAATALLAAGSVGLASSRLARARHDADSERRRVEALTRDAAEVLRLHAARARAVRADRPTEDVTPRLTAALADAGVPHDRLREVSAHGGGSDADNGATRSVRVALEPVSLPELGRVLASLRSAQRVWSPVQIEVVGDRADHLRATIVLTAAVAPP